VGSRATARLALIAVVAMAAVDFPAGLAAGAGGEAKAAKPEAGAPNVAGKTVKNGKGLSGQSGLALPRYASLRANEVNVRTGPGVRYPVKWVFMRRDLPIEIIAEFSTWRKIRDWQGTEGWVHRSMLSGKRTVIITDAVQVMRREPSRWAPAVARVEAGVVAHILKCSVEWCEVEAGGFRGWVKHGQFWGRGKKEQIQ
jgi:SH3-like domain-containing protein